MTKRAALKKVKRLTVKKDTLKDLDARKATKVKGGAKQVLPTNLDYPGCGP